MRDFGAAAFDGVSDQVLEDVDQLRVVRSDGWRGIVSHKRTALSNRCS